MREKRQKCTSSVKKNVNKIKKIDEYIDTTELSHQGEAGAGVDKRINV